MKPRALPALFLAVLLGFSAAVVASAAQSAQPTPSDAASAKAGIAITVDDLASLLERRETPRVKITNRYGGAVTGKAVSIDPAAKNISVDVSAEGIGVDGVLTVAMSVVTSIEVLVPLTPDQAASAEQASAAYIAALRRPPAAKPEAADVAAVALGVTEAGLMTPASILSTDSAMLPPDDILQTYPPAEGWGPARFSEIVRKAVVLGLQPFGKDKTFLTDYDAWKTAYNRRRDQQLEELAVRQSTNQKVPPDFELWPELAPVPSLEGAPVSNVPDEPVGDSGDEAPVGAPSYPTGE